MQRKLFLAGVASFFNIKTGRQKDGKTGRPEDGKMGRGNWEVGDF
jgi:hypothetical protein